MTIRIGINGFGRIGRCVLRRSIEKGGITIVGINDLSGIDDLAYLLKYDSISGWYPKDVSSEESILRVGGRRIPFFSSPEPSKIPWKEVGADIVIESTGAFRSRSKAQGHIDAGARKVIISAPSDDADVMIVPGVNTEDYEASKHHIVSMASCTTNSLAPVAKVLNDSFGIEHLMFTTVHAYTSSQSLTDVPQRHRRRGRAAALSIIPTTTGAAQAVERVLPELKGKMTGIAMRVPVPDGSITDICAMLQKDVTAAEVNNALLEASKQPQMRGILRVTEEALVSRDILGDSHSAIVDALSTMVLRDRMVKVLSWYDNEWGYTSRLVDFTSVVGANLI